MAAVTVVGTPVPQGSMTCVGRNGHHQLQPSNKALLKPWRALMAWAGVAVAERSGFAADGPVSVELTVTLGRPASVSLVQRRWPWKKSPGHGDSDKLARAVLDGLTGTAFGDDAQVCELHVRKVYPDTYDTLNAQPSAFAWSTDVLPQPGVSVAVRPIDA